MSFLPPLFTICAGCIDLSSPLPKAFTPSFPYLEYIPSIMALNISRSDVGSAIEFSNSFLNRSSQDVGAFLSPNTALFTINIAGTTPIIEYSPSESFTEIFSLSKDLFNFPILWSLNTPLSLNLPIYLLSNKRLKPADIYISERSSSVFAFIISASIASIPMLAALRL